MSFDYSRTASGPKDAFGGAASDGGGSKAPPTTAAAFSPNQQTASQYTRSRNSLVIHEKTPLLIATPPQVTRSLAYSHGFILPLNHFVGLLSWTTNDPWESFLLLAIFWFVVLYADDVLRWAGPVVVVVVLILAMYSRRFSPLSSTAWSDPRGKRKRADSGSRKSLEEILDTLREFTGRCDVLLDPCLRLTEYLSTQSGATSATTRPALTTLFLRILAFTPIWIVLTLPPFRIITTQRIVLTLGTIGLTWHSDFARASRTILWRSRSIREAVTLITGLQISTSISTPAKPPLPPRPQDAAAKALGVKSAKITKGTKGTIPSIRFTFVVFENQRRWLGLGWTLQLLPSERQAWTDEHLHPCPEPDQYTLPENETAATKWRWVPGGAWHVEGANAEKEQSAKRVGGGGGGDESGWTYYDNTWLDGRRVDGWSRYTRRRKWIRDAELVDINAPSDGDDDNGDDDVTPQPTPLVPSEGGEASSSVDNSAAAMRRKGWFRRTQSASISTTNNSFSTADEAASLTSAAGSSGRSNLSRDPVDNDVLTPLDRFRAGQSEWDRSVSESVWEGLS